MEKLKITLKNWDYTCRDGCCTDYGTKLYLDNEELEHPDYPEQLNNNYIGEDVGLALQSVLKKLGYDVEIETTYEE